MMIRRATIPLAIVLVVLGASCGGSTSSESSSDAMGIETALEEQNGSAQSGTALLTTVGNQTRVVLDLQSRSATPVAPRQPAHIHKGSCEKLDPRPAYGLNDVRAGKSTTMVNVRLEELIRDEIVINVHESAENVERYVACGFVSAGDGEGYDPLGHDKEDDSY